jgi:hypothetical protein
MAICAKDREEIFGCIIAEEDIISPYCFSPKEKTA